MSPKLKQFFQDAKSITFYPNGKKSKDIWEKRPVNALLAVAMEIGAIGTGLALYQGTGGAITMTGGVMAMIGYSAVKLPNKPREWVVSKFQNKPPTP